MEAEATPARRGISLGRPLGIPIYLAPSWLLIGVLFTMTSASLALETRPDLGNVAYLVGMAMALLFAASVLAHELGHSVVSLALGIPIRRITLFLLGGLAEIDREPRTPAGEYLIAIAGPLVSLFLGASFIAAAVAAPEDSVGQLVLLDAGRVNLALAVFNMVPGMPLDGGRVLRAAIWRITGDRARATRVAVRSGQSFAVLLFTAGAVSFFAGEYGGIFLILVGSFIWLSATQGLRRQELMSRIPALAARALARPALGVPADLPLSEAIRRATEARRLLFVIDSYGRPAAIVSASAVAEVPDQRRPWVTIGSVARPVGPGLLLDAELQGLAVLEALRTTQASEYLVVEPGGAVVGVLATQDVAARMSGAPA